MGGFAAAQGAIALFGGESKELEETLVKVNGALALLNGVQSVFRTIDDGNEYGICNGTY